MPRLFYLLVVTFLLISQTALAATTIQEVQTHYTSGKVRILIVPGHDQVNWGTDYRGLKEADLNLALAKKLFDYLINDPHFQVFSSRDLETGEYNNGLSIYLEIAAKEINDFRAANRISYQQSVNNGLIANIVGAPHATAKEDVAYMLNGVNKWANDNNIDIVLHLHFNDYPDHSKQEPGIYNGFNIYVPERQFGNSATSRAVAAPIFKALNKLVATSTFPAEQAGIVEDQELIAIGSNNSRQGASLLTEYGYIYDPALATASLRSIYLPELAFQTYRGLKTFFADDARLDASTLLPHTFSTNLKKGMLSKPEVLRLQRALLESGFYPPPGNSLNDCPVSGNFGNCTLRAVTAFQKKYKLPATGYVGELTRARLNRLYSK